MNYFIATLFVMAGIIVLLTKITKKQNEKLSVGLKNYKREALAAPHKNAAIAIKACVQEWGSRNCYNPQQWAAVEKLLEFIDGRISALPE